jgi:hypothetical protein
MKPLRARDLEQTTRLGDSRGTADQVADVPNLMAVIMFSVIGLLIAANLMLRFPGLALTVEQFNTFAAP